MTFYGFLSLFPLLLLLVTGLGFALEGSPGVAGTRAGLGACAVPGDRRPDGANIHSFHGSFLAPVTGVVGSLFGGLGVVQAIQNALNKIWGVPRNSRPNPFAARVRSLVLLAVGGAVILVTTLLSAVTASGGALGAGVQATAIVAAVALDVVLFTVAFRVLTARRLTIAQVRTGVIAAALVWQIIQWGGAFLLGHMLKGASATYGMFGIVLGLLT